MRKFLSVTVMVFLMAICLSGCVNKTIYNIAEENSGNDYWYLSYEYFNGFKEKEVTLSGDGEHSFSVEIVTKSGSISLEILDSEGNSLYRDYQLPSSAFVVKADVPGEYVIRVTAKDHSGGFEITWL